MSEVNGGPVLFRSNGTGGELDIGTLTTLAGLAGQDYVTTLEADGGGSITASDLSTISGADVEVSGGSQLVLGAVTGYAGAIGDATALEASGAGSLLSLPALTTITADTTNPSSLVEVEALNGGDVELPTLSEVSGGPVLFRSNGGGGKLDIGTLTSIVGPAGQDYDTTLQADGGGTLTASDLNSIGGADVVVNASGAGSLVSLPSLTTITGDTTHANSLTEVEALNGGDVELPALSEVNGGPVLFRSNGTGGELDIGTLMSIVGPAGQDYDTTLQADGGGTLTATDLNSIGGADVVVVASAAGSLVSLPALATITGDTTHANSLTQVEALNGGDVELPTLSEVSGGPVLFRSNGSGGKLDIGTLTSIVGPAGQDYDTTLQADGGGTLTASDLNSIGGADVVVDASGAGSLVSLPSLTTITADTTHTNSLTEVEALNGGDVELPALSQVNGGPVLFRSNGTGGKLDIGTLKSIVGPAGQDYDTTLEADGGGTLTATDLSSIGGANVVVEATGTGSVLSLPSLASIADTGSSTSVQALSGGDMELPTLDQIVGPVSLQSTGTGSVLDLSGLQSLTGNGGSRVLTITQGGTVLYPSLTTLRQRDDHDGFHGHVHPAIEPDVLLPERHDDDQHRHLPRSRETRASRTAAVLQVKGGMTINGQGGLSVATQRHS